MTRGTQYKTEEKEALRQQRIRLRAKRHTVAVIDCETDPFGGPDAGTIRPFVWGFYDGSSFHHWWGPGCTAKLIAHIRELETKHIIYAHNGGKFDFTMRDNDNVSFLDIVEPDLFTIGSRIVKAEIVANNGVIHQLRDSFALIPESLGSAGEKLAIDYTRMSKRNRNRHRQEITEYLKQDCVSLWEAVNVVQAELGTVLTMAAGSMKKLNVSMSIRRGSPGLCYERLSEAQDAELRPFYYGGRVQCFKQGIFEAEKDGFMLVDINSSYANVMKRYFHPVSAGYVKGENTITDTTDFALIEATSYGALPFRDIKTGSLTFPVDRRLFQATGHEIRAARTLGLLTIHKVHETWTALERTNFADFIDHYYTLRLRAKETGDKLYTMLWKRVMNGAYGKFAQNPREFKDTLIVRSDEPAPETCRCRNRACGRWHHSERLPLMDIYQRQTDQAKAWRSFLNVGTGASITGAARAELMLGLSVAKDALYCDTDSIICRGFSGFHDPNILGAWKIEATGDKVAIAEKKLYAMWNNSHCIKMASKGVKASPDDILHVANGNIVHFMPLAPTFKLDGSQSFQSRKLRRKDTPKDAPVIRSENWPIAAE